MKKYLIISIISNILLSFLAFYLFLNYLVLSASKGFSTSIDLLVLSLTVILNVIINYIIFKLLKVKESKVFILIPSSIFMLLTGLLFFFIK